jgi:hypothetical protein
MAAATWWRWCRRSDRGGPARGWARAVLFAFFNAFQKSLPKAVYASPHRCAERICWGSRHRALCRPDGAECPVPRASSRQSLCRVETILCREHAALGKGCQSGSACNMDLSFPTIRPLRATLHMQMNMAFSRLCRSYAPVVQYRFSRRRPSHTTRRHLVTS